VSIEAGSDGGCPSQDPATLATKITFTVGWPTSTAGNSGTGPINILLLTTFHGTSTLTGTSQSCGLTLPDLTLNSLAAAIAGGSKVQIQVSNTAWDAITRTFPVMGTQSGFNPGDSLNTSASLGLLGLTDASGYNSDTKAWPAACATGCTPAGPFMMSDLQDDDHDSNPGITATPLSNSTYALPPTSLLSGSSAAADQVYIVSRNEISLMGMHTGTTCNTGSGMAKITLFDNHVVGCHVKGGGACNSSQVSFVDSNRTIYGYDMTMGHVISSTNPVMGTVNTIQLPAGAKCSDARTAFAPTFNQN
jgi:hypothetical protein